MQPHAKLSPLCLWQCTAMFLFSDDFQYFFKHLYFMRPNISQKCVVSMSLTQTGQSGAVGTKSGPTGPSEDLRGPQKDLSRPKRALLGAPGVP